MTQHYDVAVIGAGPVGCATALAHAQRGAKVLVVEASPEACKRLAGEWLHPPAVEALATLGVTSEPRYATGRGFVVFPDDGSERIQLPYTRQSRGLSLEHSDLVSLMRERCAEHPSVTVEMPARAVAITEQRLTYQARGHAEVTVGADWIVGAGGRSSIAHKTLGVEQTSATYSRMAGLLLEDVELPNEGFGHVFLGGPGPVLTYRLNERYVRMCLDVPLSMPVSREKEAVLWEAFKPVLPQQLHRAVMDALRSGRVSWAANQTRPRVAFGREGLALVGDAVGHHHPLTAIGMTMGFQDALTLANSKSFEQYRRRRLHESRVPEMLAVALYEVFADTSDELVAIRQAVYDMWRKNATERERTMAFLACQNTGPSQFGASFVKAVALATKRLALDTARSGQWRRSAKLTGELIERCRWLLSGALRFSDPVPSQSFLAADSAYGPALKASSAKADVVEHPAATLDRKRRQQAMAAPHVALERAVKHLKSQQAPDGAWEGECIWNAMLPAQYTLMCRITGTPISEQRRRLILRQFEATQLADGTWSMHELGEPFLFMTALIYVAARCLGVAADAPLLARAGRFIANEGGVEKIPSWGKFWLALVGLYDWDGVNPVLPEVWQLPEWVPAHPSNYYCHTRLIYLGMAMLYGERFELDPELTQALRRELYPAGMDRVDFAKARHALRKDEIFTPPSLALRLAYDALRLFNREAVSAERRRELRRGLLEHVRFELHSTDYTCISPVNGLLNLVALWHHDPADADFQRGVARFEGWIWEDETDGTRMCGARSASWDTAFAVQALTAASPHFDVTDALERADAFLASQQIRTPQARDYERFHRIDPTGGYCFAGVWHGWPVSDCTAEAVVARLEGPVAHATVEQMTEAVEFILRTECPDGGFGSYEPFRPLVGLEWLNPAEMFGDSMTEHPYVECTASCAAALRSFRERFPEVMAAPIERALRRAELHMRALQRPDGSFAANWGVHFIYGTMFGIRGLLACGVAPFDPAIRKACRWLRAHQRPDGSWGESHETCLTERYTPHRDGQVIQTAWALTALLEAEDPDFDAIDRAAHFLASRQNEDGSFPKEDPAGVFFHTALLHYELYRSYFPVWALGLYETRRLERLAMRESPRSRRLAHPPTSA